MKQKILVKIGVITSFLVMIIVNALANILPINGMNTGAISNLYPNLFAPAPLTFSIWGLIYLLLLLFVLYQTGIFTRKKSLAKDGFLEKVGIYFIVTSLANTFWIFSWHYNYIALSVIFMAILLFGLIKIIDLIKLEKLSRKEKLFISLPFSIYFGWIMVATIANITTFLVSLNWNGFGLPETTWMVVILFTGTVIGLWRMARDRNLIYGLVFIWAYFGILIRHLSVDGFAGQYPNVVMATSVCILIFIISLFFINKKRYD